MKALIVFYTRDGSTGQLAEMINKYMNTTMIQIKDKKNRQGILGYIRAGWDALKKNTTEITHHQIDPAHYDIVIIGTPVWAGFMTPAIRSFILENREKLNRVAFFTTYGFKAEPKLYDGLADLSHQNPVATIGVKKKELNDPETEESVEDFVEMINNEV